MEGGPAKPVLKSTRYALQRDTSETNAAAALEDHHRGEISGYIHSYETGGTVDGPGIRFVLFLSGCYFRCQYCHNPETWRLNHGWHVTVDDVMKEIEPYKDFLIGYRGGVTLSGGEVLVQHSFAGNILRRCKERGLHTALDTNGFLGHLVSPQMMADVDLWLLDIKSFDPAIHRKVTGQSVQPVLDFARHLSDEQQTMWIRFVLVPGLTDDVDNVEGLAAFVASLDGVERVEVLPFHKMGEYKWRELGLDYKLRETQPPNAQLLARVHEQFASRGLKVV